jgi:hypothetical protein
MSAHEKENNEEYNKGPDVPSLPCPASIEIYSRKEGKEEIVPGFALQRYTFAQLVAHLESDIHTHRELVSVALRASIYFYRHVWGDAFEKIDSIK